MQAFINTSSIRFRVLGAIALVFSIFSVFSVWTTAVELHKQVIREATTQADAVADSVLSSLNSMMVQDSIHQRKKFIDLLKGTTRGMENLRVFRSKSVTKQFGPGLPGEQPIDEIDRKVLSTGKSSYTIIENETERKFRAVIPFISTINRGGVDCTECHDTNPGTVNGAVSMVMNLEEIDNQISSSLTKLSLLNLAGLILLLGAVMLIQYKLVLEPLRIFRSTIEEIESESNLAKRIGLESSNEVGMAAESFDRMLDTFQPIVSQMASTAEHLASATTELSYATEQNSGKATIQSEKAGEMTRAIEEVERAISSIASNAVNVARTSENTRQRAMTGGNVLRSGKEVIEKLADYSVKIDLVLRTIDEIAKKTDLLAVNASIEAANAGEQGRGFSVVAEEVRKLAERTSNATGEIVMMIADIRNFTGSAVVAMNDSTSAMKDIIKEATRVSDMVEKIAQSTEDQAGIVGDLLASVKVLKEYSEGFVSSAKQSSEVAGDMASQSVKLQDIVDRFKL